MFNELLSCISIKSYTLQPGIPAETVLQRAFYFTRIFDKTMMYWGIFVLTVLTTSGLVQSNEGKSGDNYHHQKNYYLCMLSNILFLFKRFMPYLILPYLT